MAVVKGSVELYSAGIKVGSAPYYSGLVLQSGAAVDGMYASGGGAAQSTQIASGGLQVIGDGGFAYQTNASAYGSQYIGFGGSASGTVISGSKCVMQVQDGGRASQVDVKAGATAWVVSGGVISGMTLSSGGILRFSDYAKIYGLKQEAGGLINLSFYETGTVDTEITGTNAQGDFYYRDGDFFNFVVYKKTYTANVTSGHQAVNTQLNNAAFAVENGAKSEKTLVCGGSETIESGGAAKNTTVMSGGRQFVCKGGEAANTLVASGGRLFVSNGGVVSDCRILDGGSMAVSGGAAMDGVFDCQGNIYGRNQAGGTIDASKAVINCDVTERTAASIITESIAMIESLNLFNGVTLTITVANDLDTGIYKLATDAADYTKDIAVYCDSFNQGTLKVDGSNEVICGNNTYSLLLSEGDLALSVSATRPGAICCSEWTDGENVSVTWNGIKYDGTVGDGLFFNNQVKAETAIGASGERIVFFEPEEVAGVKSYDAFDTVLTSNSTYNRIIMGGLLDSNNKDYTGSYTFTIENGTFNSEVTGGDAVQKRFSRTGDITFNITGGTFNGNVIGGGYYAGQIIKGQYTLIGDICFTISGGTFAKRIYGGCAGVNEEISSMANMKGNVYLTIDASDNAISFGENVAAGNRGNGSLWGSTNVKVTGLGSNLSFADSSVLFGGCGGDCYQVLLGGRIEDTSVYDPATMEDPGKRNLSFDDFSGNFNAEIRMFSDISFINGTEMNFTDAELNLQDISTWNFDCTSFAGNLNKNAFFGDTINIDTDALRNGSWTLLSGNAEAFLDIGSAMDVFFKDSKATYEDGVWTDGNYTLAVEEENNKANLVISRVGIA